MHDIEKQLQIQVLTNHFEPESHHDISKLKFDNLRLLSSEEVGFDVLVIQYKNSPLLSFYSINGKLLDIDAYLTAEYYESDIALLEEIAQKLDTQALNFDETFSITQLTKEATTNKHLITFLNQACEIQLELQDLEQFIKAYKQDNISDIIQYFPSSKQFLFALIKSRYEEQYNYVHSINDRAFIIRSFDKSNGYSVIIETHDEEGQMLPSDKWIISRSNNKDLLERSLSFRSSEIRSFFASNQYIPTWKTERYLLKQHDNTISIDSLLDNTSNLLTLDTINQCYHSLSLDKNILGVLSKSSEFCIINTYNSIIPKKWLKRINLPANYAFARMDDHLRFILAQQADGTLDLLLIENNTCHKIRSLGVFALGFEITQSGNIICYDLEKKLVYISTNLDEIQQENEDEGLSEVFEKLRGKLQGESLFEQIHYPNKVTENDENDPRKTRLEIDKLRYEFEANIEDLLLDTNDEYDKLLELKEKLAIARINIMEELVQQIDTTSLSIGGRRLSSIVNSIVRPTEKKVQEIIHNVRLRTINHELASISGAVESIDKGDAFKEVINKLRGFEQEIQRMSTHVDQNAMTSYKQFKSTINQAFTGFIDQSDSKIAGFIQGEIEELHKVIESCNDLRTLEILLSTNPAAIELFSMLKQEFILKTLSEQSAFSPVNIQKQLHAAVDKKKILLIADNNRLKANQERAKHLLRDMIRESIEFFVNNHSKDFSELTLQKSSNYTQIQSDIRKIESEYNDLKLAADLRRDLEYKIVEKNSIELARIISHEGKYAFVQNDADLYIDINNKKVIFPTWNISYTPLKDQNSIEISFIRDSDKEKFIIDVATNLLSNSAFHVEEKEFPPFHKAYAAYNTEEYNLYALEMLHLIHIGEKKAAEAIQLTEAFIKDSLPTNIAEEKALRVALMKHQLDSNERQRIRNIPRIPLNYVDDTPYFQDKLAEFFIKAKIQLLDESGILLLSGPPSTGKSAFLRFIAAITNREYFEHVSDKWQTKNSLVNSIKFGNNGPYSIPAGFTKAITTSNAIINIEEIKEWPEALRKSLNPFFAGSKEFIAPDGTIYKIGENIILCAAANLGSFYRQDDEPFTSDFWSRIDVVEYDYAPETVSKEYIDALFKQSRTPLTMKDMIRNYFKINEAPEDAKMRTHYIAKSVISFFLLPKADEQIKRNTLEKHIDDYFAEDNNAPDVFFSPEESAKIALKRLRQLSDLSLKEFYDLYNHFINSVDLRSAKLKKLSQLDPDKYNHYSVLFHCIHHVEGCLRHLREVFYISAGRTEIEGTNREFIRALYLIDLLGDIH